MKQPKTRITMKHYKIYLIFMLVACGGASWTHREIGRAS